MTHIIGLNNHKKGPLEQYFDAVDFVKDPEAPDETPKRPPYPITQKLLVTHREDAGMDWYSEPVVYVSWTKPNGALEPDMACQACMTYCMRMSVIFKETKENLVYEDQWSKRINPWAMLTATAQEYGVKAEDVVKYWPQINQQRSRLKISYHADLPRWIKYPEKDKRAFTL